MPKTDVALKEVEELKAEAPAAPKEEGLKREDIALDEERLQIISFFLGEDEYAFEVSDAVEVLRQRQLTEVPRTPEFIKGILSVRGEMVPIFDLKKRLQIGATEISQTGRILIASIEDLKAGFMVDRLSGVRDVPMKAFEPCPDDSGFLKGFIYHNNRVIRLLDPANLIDIAR